MIRRLSLGTLLAVLGTALFPTECRADTRKQPNILFIYTDDQSYKTVGCYPESWPWVKTPNIDALAKSGVRFHARLPRGVVHAVAGVAAHRPASARHRVDADGRRVSRQHLRPEAVPVLAGVFRKNGYHTAQIGKWHTGTDAGFGRDWDYQIVWNRPKHPDNAGAYYDQQLLAFNGEERTVDGYPADNYTKWACEYISGGAPAEGQALVPLALLRQRPRPVAAGGRHKGLTRTRRCSPPADISRPAAGQAGVSRRTRWRGERPPTAVPVAGKSGEKFGDESGKQREDPRRLGAAGERVRAGRSTRASAS